MADSAEELRVLQSAIRNPKSAIAFALLHSRHITSSKRGLCSDPAYDNAGLDQSLLNQPRRPLSAKYPLSRRTRDMRVLITGHNGYIGSVMSRLISTRHDVVGLDTYYFERCTLGTERADLRALRVDLRDVREEHLAGFDAVIHLAAVSNDPLGDLRAETTYEINHRAAVRLAQMAKAAGVPRFLFASSCSLYGVAGDEMLDENAGFHPITPFGESK